MAEFTFNNAKNANIGYTPFKLNYGYHFKILFKEDIDSRSKSRSIADKLAKKLKKLIEVCCQNLLHTQEL